MKSLASGIVHSQQGLATSGSKGHAPNRRSRRLITRFLALGAAGALAVALMPGAAFAKPAQPQVAAATASGDWTQFRHDASNSGYNAAESIISAANAGALGLRWKGAVNPNDSNSNYRIIESSPAVANGVVYIGSRNSGQLFAYAVGCGAGGSICQPLWSATTDNWWISSSPAIYSHGSSRQVIIGGAGGKLWAFDADGVTNCSGTAPTRTCTALWTGQTGAAITGSPAVYNGVVYVGSNDKKVYAFDPNVCGTTGASCAPLWTGTTTGMIHSSPAVAPAVSGGNPFVYVASDDGTLYAWDAVACSSAGGSCLPLWTATPSGGVLYSPAVANGLVYIADAYWHLDAYDAAGRPPHCTGSPKTCTPLWQSGTGANIQASPAVANGVVYLESYQFFCGISASDGSNLWCSANTNAGNSKLSSPAVANGVVYVGDNTGKMYAYDAAGVIGRNGSEVDPLWTYTTGADIESSPAVANGVVYVGSDDGYLYAFGLNPLDHLVLSPSGATIAAGGSQAYTAQGFDAYGNSLGDVTSGTTFTIGGGGSCNGYSCTSTAPGDYTVTGTDGTVTGTATLHVTPGPLDHLVLSPADATVAAGVSQAYTAQGFDAYGNSLGDVTSGTILTTSGFGSCTGNSCMATSPGTVWVSGTDGHAGGAMAFLHVTPAAATHLAVSGFPSSDVAGAAHNITVTALDAYGNTATGYGGTVHFSSSDTKAVLPANATLSAGVGTFSVTLKTAGTQSVTATDTVTATIKGSQSGIVVNAAALSKLVVSGLSSPRTAGSPGTIRVTAVDAYGNRVHSYLGTVHFSSSDTKAKLPANYKFTAADAGTHVFSVTLKTAGTQSVTATDTLHTAIKGSQSGIVVKAAAVKTLTVSGLSSPRTAGTAGSIRVTAVDAYGNRIHGYLGTIHFTSTDTNAKLPANYKFTAADAGTHVFSVTLKTAGTRSVTATDTNTATIKGSQTGIVVKAAALSKLVVSGMTTPRTAGTNGNIRVTATDAYGNRVSSYRGTVHFTSSDAKAKLPANYKFTAADAGTHVFSVTLKTAGTQSVTATDTKTKTIKGSQTKIAVK